MGLDRQSIEKRDFPIGRRGYEPRAVDAHLARVASELEAIARSPVGGSGTTLSSAASEHVRAIVEAAESSAAEIERRAHDDAGRTRDEAVSHSQEHVARVTEATSSMLKRVDAMESELVALVQALRTGGQRLNADLARLQETLGELYGKGADSPSAAADGEQVTLDAPAEAATEPPLAPEQAAAIAPEAAPVAEPAVGADADGARLIALDMALSGQSREETDRSLAENFPDLGDRGTLLDEVYATLEE